MHIRLISAVIALLFYSNADASTVPAVQSDSFVEFIGVNTQLSWSGTIWDTGSSVLQSRLGELGVRYVRTTIGTSKLAKAQVLALNSKFGIRAEVLVQPRKLDGTLDPTRIAENLRFIAQEIGRDKVISVEGPNEYSQTKYQGNASWATQIRSFQAKLYDQVKADNRLTGVKVVAPTIWHRFLSDYSSLGNIAQSADLGNLHYYNGGRKPTLYAREEKYLVPFHGVESAIDHAISDARTLAPGKKIMVTETGFNVQLPIKPGGVTSAVSAKYMLRLFSELFLRRSSVEKVFAFSLLDAGPGQAYGLLNPDLSRRPAFYALKCLIRILADKGSAFSPGSLTFDLTGDTGDLRTVVLQKRSGRFYLLIWRDVDSFDRKRLVGIDVVRRPVQLTLEPGRFSSLNVYRPTALGLSSPDLGVRPVSSFLRPSNLRLDIPDEVMVVELVP